MDTVKPSIASVVGDIRAFLFAGFQTFPFTMAGTMLILGLMTANYAMLFFLVGFLIGVPLLVLGFNAVMEFIGTSLVGSTNPVDSMSWFKATNADICRLVIPFGPTKRGEPTTDPATYWTAMTAFFIGYVLTNATMIYGIETIVPPGATESEKARIEAGSKMRRSQAVVAMVATAAIALIFFGTRLFRTGCESTLGMILTVGIFGSLGAGWYAALATAAGGRVADIFGIANRILAPQALVNQPVACLPVAGA